MITFIISGLLAISTFLVIGAATIYFAPYVFKWADKHWDKVENS